MEVPERAIDFAKRNVILAVSIVLTVLPAVGFSIYLTVKYIIEFLTVETSAYLVGFCAWTAMGALVVAVAWRRVKKLPSYPFPLVFGLIAAQSFMALEVTYAAAPIAAFVVFYRLFKLYNYAGDGREHKDD